MYIYIPFFLLQYLDVVTSTYHHSTEICTMDTVRPSCWSFRQNCSARASAVQCAALWPAFLALPLHHIWFLLQGARGSPLNVASLSISIFIAMSGVYSVTLPSKRRQQSLCQSCGPRSHHMYHGCCIGGEVRLCTLSFLPPAKPQKINPGWPFEITFASPCYHA
jgi:hypothetical protein